MLRILVPPYWETLRFARSHSALLRDGGGHIGDRISSRIQAVVDEDDSRWLHRNRRTARKGDLLQGISVSNWRGGERQMTSLIRCRIALWPRRWNLGCSAPSRGHICTQKKHKKMREIHRTGFFCRIKLKCGSFMDETRVAVSGLEHSQPKQAIDAALGR